MRQLEVDHHRQLIDVQAARGELDQALTRATRGDTAAYIEVVTDTYAAPPMALTLHDNINTLYHS